MSLRASALDLEVDTLGLRTGSPTPSMRVPPPWVFPGAAIDFDFVNNRYWQEGAPEGRPVATYLTTSRASTGYINDNTGIWYSVANNLPRISNQGLMVEEARTNDALWCRDMTNAVWVAVTMTAAKTATGIDGVANSASTLTATGASATILQTITLGSAADTYSVWLKRVSGTGTVNISIDGSTWVAAAVTNTWTQFQTQKTAANPVFGIQIVTSGDVVAADFNQLEPGGFATSPILTTSATVTRATDVVSAAKPTAFGSTVTLFAQGIPQAPLSFGTNQAILAISDNTSNNRAVLFRLFGSGVTQTVVTAAGVFLTAVSEADVWAQNVREKIDLAVASGDYAGASAGLYPQVSAVSGLPTGLNKIYIGAGHVGSNTSFNGLVERIALWPITRLSNVTLQRLVT